jgi:hypothetical protein
LETDDTPAHLPCYAGQNLSGTADFHIMEESILDRHEIEELPHPDQRFNSCLSSIDSLMLQNQFCRSVHDNHFLIQQYRAIGFVPTSETAWINPMI